MMPKGTEGPLIADWSWPLDIGRTHKVVLRNWPMTGFVASQELNQSQYFPNEQVL